MIPKWTIAAAIGVGASLLWGCATQQPAVMAPPVNQAPPGGYSSAPPVSYNNGAPPATAGVFQWQDVPAGQQIPVTRATFDQGGYQIFAASGETIVVPFVNQNLYAMKFGRTSGQPYFVNEGAAPTLYLQPGGFLENAAAQNARWYPIPNDYSYTRPMYVTLAPSWNDYTSMGWYPGMNYYGGMWGYNPYGGSWMPGYYISIGSHRYTTYSGYHTYYTSNPGYIRNRVVYNNYSTPRGSFNTGRTGSFGGTRSPGGTGSFGTGRTTVPSGGTGSFGNGRSTAPVGGTGSFGNGRTTAPAGGTGSFGNGRSTPSTGFGGATTPSTRPGSGSFGGGASGSTNTPRSSGSSFGGGSTTRPSGGSSFGGGSTTRPSGGSTSRPSGGSFGGGGRRR